MAFDLSKNNLAEKAEAGYEFEVIVPGTVEATDFFIKVRGTESTAVRTYSRKKFKEMQLKEQMAKRKNKEVPVPELEEIEEELLEVAVGRIITWRGIFDNKVEVAFSQENARKILSEHTWIRDLVLKESNEIENFR